MKNDHLYLNIVMEGVRKIRDISALKRIREAIEPATSSAEIIILVKTFLMAE